MSDDTGIFQHAVHAIADRSHGYCIDDNARALLLCCGLAGGPDAPLARRLSSTFAAFIQHGWNPGNRRFRNFMGFDRRWLEDAGSEDSHGRTLWALGAYSARACSLGHARWAKRSEEHTSELQSLMRISYAVFCLKKKKKNNNELIRQAN